MFKRIIPLTFLTAALGCGGETPTGMPETNSSSGGAGSSPCYTVSGALDQSGVGAELSGTISGDIEGTVATVGGPVVLNGVVLSRPGEQTWEITGGEVNPLIGNTLRFDVEVLAIGAQPPVYRINTTARVVEGAQSGELTYHGITDVSTVPFTSHLVYHGVICP